MKISEFRERMRDYVEGDQASLDDEEWWVQVTDLSLLVLAERARVKRERAQDNPMYREWKRKQAERQRNAAVNAVPDKQRDVERCPATWNPGVWPYTTRCVLNANHNNYLHHDRHGNTFTRNQPPTHDAGEYRDPSTGEVDVEAHRFTFEGSTGLLARHLIHDHGVPPRSVVHWSGGLTQGDWTALDELHRDAHRKVGESYDGA